MPLPSTNTIMLSDNDAVRSPVLPASHCAGNSSSVTSTSSHLPPSAPVIPHQQGLSGASFFSPSAAGSAPLSHALIMGEGGRLPVVGGLCVATPGDGAVGANIKKDGMIVSAPSVSPVSVLSSTSGRDRCALVLPFDLYLP